MAELKGFFRCRHWEACPHATTFCIFIHFDPLPVTTLWVCVDASDKANGCLRVFPRCAFACGVPQ